MTSSFVSTFLPAPTVQDSQLPMVYPLGHAHNLMNGVKMVGRSSLQVLPLSLRLLRNRWKGSLNRPQVLFLAS